MNMNNPTTVTSNLPPTVTLIMLGYLKFGKKLQSPTSAEMVEKFYQNASQQIADIDEQAKEIFRRWEEWDYVDELTADQLEADHIILDHITEKLSHSQATIQVTLTLDQAKVINQSLAIALENHPQPSQSVNEVITEIRKRLEETIQIKEKSNLQ